MYVQIPLQDLAFNSFGYALRSGIINCNLNFLRKCHVFSIVAVPFYILTSGI
jgi:hypothetical protein